MCEAISNSDEYFPPVLPRRTLPDFHLAGGWLSLQCETRPHNLRLTRHVIFEADNRTWQAFYHHFYDELCRQPMFSLRAQGRYVISHPSVLVDGAYDVDFEVTAVKITARDPRVMRTLNEWSKSATPCGAGKEQWVLDREQDVTGSKGCPPLGVRMDAIEQELVRIDRDDHKRLLFMGRRPTQAPPPGAQATRPTAFQAPLMQCSEGGAQQVMDHVTLMDEISLSVHGSPSSSSSLLPRPLSLLLLLLLLFMVT